MDYRELLTKYMALISDVEGVTYVGHANQSDISDVVFTDAEVAELEHLRDTTTRDLSVD